jgi:hypothetical protein
MTCLTVVLRMDVAESILVFLNGELPSTCSGAFFQDTVTANVIFRLFVGKTTAGGSKMCEVTVLLDLCCHRDKLNSTNV